MDNALISKIEKARQYAEERERFCFTSFAVSFKGKNNDHQVSFGDGAWVCDCEFFGSRGFCAHTMALERMLEDMLPE